MELKGSQTEGNLKAAFAGESQANRRYLYFAQQADIEGHNDVAMVFRSTAEGETGMRTGISNICKAAAVTRNRHADRQHGRQSEIGNRGRNPRIYRYVSRHGAHRAR